MPLRFYYNTVICSPDTHNRLGHFATHWDGRNLPSGAHEVWNNIFVVQDTKRYPGTPHEYLARHISCQQSTAGTWHLDYNCYHRDVPGSIATPFFWNIQDSRNVNRESFDSLALFKGSSKFTLSASMYSDGTTGHEQHGVQENPQFVDLDARDYRPQSTTR